MSDDVQRQILEELRHQNYLAEERLRLEAERTRRAERAERAALETEECFGSPVHELDTSRTHLWDTRFNARTGTVTYVCARCGKRKV